MLFLVIKCTKPAINGASLNPPKDSITYDDQYTVTCNNGYVLSGDETIKCGTNGFDRIPTCDGKI